ncbi:MAG: succinylglutamate desuccinylase/aspartoacylase family protein [Bacillota bacterium]
MKLRQRAILALTIICVLVVAAMPAAATTRTVTLSAGTRYETKMYIIDSGKPGPDVMIIGGVHGSEPAGYMAARQMKSWTPKRGRLIVLPEANKPAVDQKRRVPSGGYDLNRAFPTYKGDTANTYHARAIWSAMQRYGIDVLIDLHEGSNFHRVDSSSVGQSIIYYPSTRAKAMAYQAYTTLNRKVSLSREKFSLLRYPVKGSIARAAGQYLGIDAMIIETCTKNRLSERIDYHLTAVRTILSYLGTR